MKRLAGRFQALLWTALVAALAAALLLQAASAHRANIELRGRIESLDRQICVLEAENGRLEEETRELREDRYAVERELRKIGLIAPLERILGGIGAYLQSWPNQIKSYRSTR